MKIAILTNLSPESWNPFHNRVGPLTEALAERVGPAGEVHLLSTGIGPNASGMKGRVRVTGLDQLADAAPLLRDSPPDRLLIDLDAVEFTSDLRNMRQVIRLLGTLPHIDGESLGCFVANRLLSRQRRWTGLRIQFHAATLRKMLRRAGRTFVFSTLAKERLSAKMDADHIRILPSGSGIRAAKISKDAARSRVGFENKSGAALVGVIGEWKELEPNLLAAAGSEIVRLIPGSRILYLGPDGEKVRRAVPMCPLLDAGALPEEEIAKHLRAMDFVVLPYRDGCTMAQPELAACLLHGLPVASNGSLGGTDIGMEFETLPQGLTVTEWGDLGTFLEGIEELCRCHNDGEIDILRSGLERFHDDHFSWGIIAGALLATWGPEPGGETDWKMTPEPAT